MFSLGLAGGLDLVHEQALDTSDNYTYDGAAVLVKDGVVVAAIEEERLDRIKHSNKFPLQAIQFCLDQGRLRLQDIDRIGYYVDEKTADILLTRMYLERPEIPQRINARTLLQMTLSRGLGYDVDPSRLCFYEHKLTHAACAMHHSGFDQSLVFVIDNEGGVYLGQRNGTGNVSMEALMSTSSEQSLQRLCHAVFPFLGLSLFEEYKATALATYGNPERYIPVLKKMYELLPNGEYRLHLDRAGLLVGALAPRRTNTEHSQDHKDLAAALQYAVEEIALHVLTYFRNTTGLRKLCMAGGMAENTSTNGQILYSNLFDHLFVHPAAYDSGCAIGAAFLAAQDANMPSQCSQLQTVRWGSDIGDNGSVTDRLHDWKDLLQSDKHEDISCYVAELIAQGALIGWVNGRSEFGSHALGARNALADPRSFENRDRLHKALDRSELYRPLAAIILEEDINEWCDVPPGTDSLPFQTFAVRVRADKKKWLSGAMQRNGNARLQTVSQTSNPRLWAVVKAFGELTGARVLLSTSFNSSIEPSVESTDDAIASFLCSGLDYLVLGDSVATKVTPRREHQMSLYVSLPPYVRIMRAKGFIERERCTPRDEIRTTFTPENRKSISRQLADVLLELNQQTLVSDLVKPVALDPDSEQRLVSELFDLWSHRMIILRPVPDQPKTAFATPRTSNGYSTTEDYIPDIARATEALEDALAHSDLSRFYRVFRSTRLPFLCFDFKDDARRLFPACFKILHSLGAISPAVALAVENHFYVTSAIATFPTITDPQLHHRRETLLSSIVNERWLVANTNSRIHSNKVGQIGTIARREGTDFIIDGTASYTSLATEADLLVLITELQGEGSAVFEMALNQGNPAIEIGPYLFPSTMLDSDTRQITFHNLRLPQEALIATLQQNQLTKRLLPFEMTWHQLLIPSLYLGAAAGAIETARAFLTSTLGRNGMPLAELDGVVVDIGRLVIEYRRARLVIERAGEAIYAFQKLPRDEHILEQAAPLASVAKYVGTRTAESIVTSARRIVGARTFAGGCTLERLSQEVMFGPLGPEVNAVTERHYGKQTLKSTSFLDLV